MVKVVERADRTAAPRTRIADAALAQVAAGGYASATVTAVAHRAGVAAGSVYTYFPSKGDLFAEVFRDANAGELALVAEIAARHADPVPDRLAAAVDAWARRALAGPTLAWALMGEPVDPAVEAERPPPPAGGRAARPAGRSRPGASRGGPAAPGVEAGGLASKRGFRAVFAALPAGGVGRGETGPLAARIVAFAIVGAMQGALLA